MYNTRQMVTMNSNRAGSAGTRPEMGTRRTTGNGRGTVTSMNGWVEMQLVQARSRSEALAGEARSERLARLAGRDRRTAPSLRVRFDAAVAAWKQPGKVAAA